MKLVATYLERAARCARLAALDKNPIREQLLEQAEAYYQLAVKRAKTLGRSLPTRRPSSAEAERASE